MRISHLLGAVALVTAVSMVGACASGGSTGPGYCGDGVTQFELSEECDDGNAIAGDGCSPTCISEVGMELDCTNGVDDDLDGLTDCDDPGCATHPSCAGTTETSCTDGVDNDADLQIDCDDSDCYADPACQTGGEQICDDTLDNDGDGVTDCGDSDCEGRTCDANNRTCQLGVCTCATGQNAEILCDDGVDDDCDGDTDCFDSECAGAPECQGVETVCNDGVDNDGDGSTDCLDADCAGGACGLNGEVCSNGSCVCPGSATETQCTDITDNDCDGAIDCADSDCAANPACINAETVCDDLIDNDGDGSTDCQDTDCLSQPCDAAGRTCTGGQCTCPGGATETACNDGADNDCDGFTDCGDSDCTSNPACVTTETNCVDGIDNDGDGATDCADSDCNGTSCGLNGRICMSSSCQCPGGTTEVCGNGVDDNCDGQIDENCGGGTCTLPLSPSIECGAGNHCIPQPGIGSQGLCSGPTGAGGQYSFCTDNSSCGDIYECVHDGVNLLCLQWCTGWLDCPDPINMECYPLNTPAYIGVQEWGICYVWP